MSGVVQTKEIKFIVDHNVGKLAKWLRMMGYDALLFKEEDDGSLVRLALAEDRVVLTKDSQIMKRRVVTSGKLKAVFLDDDDPKVQLRKVIETLCLDCQHRPFSLCLECNYPLVERAKEEVRGRVPPYVFETQEQFMECPSCHRIYWRGTHWMAMKRVLQRLVTEEDRRAGDRGNN
jgi:uncharacterized protein with PIN domain